MREPILDEEGSEGARLGDALLIRVWDELYCDTTDAADGFSYISGRHAWSHKLDPIATELALSLRNTMHNVQPASEADSGVARRFFQGSSASIEAVAERIQRIANLKRNLAGRAISALLLLLVYSMYNLVKHLLWTSNWKTRNAHRDCCRHGMSKMLRWCKVYSPTTSAPGIMERIVMLRRIILLILSTRSGFEAARTRSNDRAAMPCFQS